MAIIDLSLLSVIIGHNYGSFSHQFPSLFFPCILAVLLLFTMLIMTSCNTPSNNTGIDILLSKATQKHLQPALSHSAPSHPSRNRLIDRLRHRRQRFDRTPDTAAHIRLLPCLIGNRAQSSRVLTHRPPYCRNQHFRLLIVDLATLSSLSSFNIQQ